MEQQTQRSFALTLRASLAAGCLQIQRKVVWELASRSTLEWRTGPRAERELLVQSSAAVLILVCWHDSHRFHSRFAIFWWRGQWSHWWIYPLVSVSVPANKYALNVSHLWSSSWASDNTPWYTMISSSACIFYPTASNHRSCIYVSFVVLLCSIRFWTIWNRSLWLHMTHEQGQRSELHDAVGPGDRGQWTYTHSMQLQCCPGRQLLNLELILVMTDVFTWLLQAKWVSCANDCGIHRFSQEWLVSSSRLLSHRTLKAKDKQHALKTEWQSFVGTVWDRPRRLEASSVIHSWNGHCCAECMAETCHETSISHQVTLSCEQWYVCHCRSSTVESESEPGWSSEAVDGKLLVRLGAVKELHHGSNYST